MALVYFPPDTRVAKAWAGELRIPSDPGGLHSGGRGHDRLRIDLEPKASLTAAATIALGAAVYHFGLRKNTGEV